MNRRTRLKAKSAAVCVVLTLCLILSGISMPVRAASDGGWSVSKAKTSFLTGGQKKVFKKAVKKLKGVKYKPVALLAKQTVAGTNYVYLCQGTTVSTKKVKGWYIVTASKDLKKKVSLRSIKKIKVSKVKTCENPRTQTLAGGLQIVPVKNKKAALSKSTRKVFRKAFKKYTGFDMRPVALLGTQVTAGKNYRILCYGQNYSVKDYFIVDIYRNTSGKCKILSVKPLNLEKYVE